MLLDTLAKDPPQTRINYKEKLLFHKTRITEARQVEFINSLSYWYHLRPRFFLSLCSAILKILTYSLWLLPSWSLMIASALAITCRWQHPTEGMSVHCLLSPFIGRKKSFPEYHLGDVYSCLIGQNHASYSGPSQSLVKKMGITIFKLNGSRVTLLEIGRT